MLSEAYELGALVGADRRTRWQEAIPTAPGKPAGIARLARRETRGAEAESIRAEAELLGRVQHENVARCYDAGDAPEVGAYFVREKIEGADLATYLRANGPQSTKRTAEIARALASAVRALEESGRIAAIDPCDVWIESGTGRAVLVSARPGDGSVPVPRGASAQAVADVLIGCARGHLSDDERERGRARVEVVEARRAGASTPGIPEEIGEIVEACVVRGAESERPTAAALQECLGRVGQGSDPSVQGVRSACRLHASEIEELLRASSELDVPRGDLPLPQDLSRLLASVDAGAASSDEWLRLEGELRGAATELQGAVREALEQRASALQSEWSGFAHAAGPFVEVGEDERFHEALRVVRGQASEARVKEAGEALAHAREALVSAREAARRVAEQRTRRDVDVLARELDDLETAHPGARLDPRLEPRCVRDEARALVEEGCLVKAHQRVQEALGAVATERTTREKAALQATARDLADRAVAFRREPGSLHGDVAARALDGVERRLAEMVEHLKRGDFETARVVSETVGADLKRLDWERELAAADPEGNGVPGMTELDEVRHATARLRRGETGEAVRRDLNDAVDALERSTRGVWADAIARIREMVGREAWGPMIDTLGTLRAQFLEAAFRAVPGGVEFRPSAELTEVLRVLAEAEREAPPASADHAARLKALRASGEAMLARLDADRARAAAPERVDRLIEHCAAAAEAERRGDHASAIEELGAANAILEELLGATDGPGREVSTEALPSDSCAPDGSGAARSASEVAPRSEPGDGAADPAAATDLCAEAADDPAEGAIERSPEVSIESTGGASGALSQALAAVEHRAYIGLALALLAVAWWTWAPSDWWGALRGGQSVAFRRGPVSTSLPTSYAPRAGDGPTPRTLYRDSLPEVLRVSVTRDEEPSVVWWLGRRAIERGRAQLEVAGIVREATVSGALLRATVGEGPGARTKGAWQIE